MKKFKEVLLIDDGRGTNSLNKRLLEEMGVVEKVTIALNGQLALDYLTTKNGKDEFPNPDVIFLDINMPVMDGYQFLDRYESLKMSREVKSVIVMLTTSISEIDMKRTANYDVVKGYQFKPLTKDKVNGILNEVF